MSNPKIDTSNRSEKRNKARDAVKDFLKQNSSGKSKPLYCNVCGETMQYLNAYFWLDGTDVASQIPLPFCPTCEPDLLTSLRRERGLERLPKAS